MVGCLESEPIDLGTQGAAGNGGPAGSNGGVAGSNGSPGVAGSGAGPAGANGGVAGATGAAGVTGEAGVTGHAGTGVAGAGATGRAGTTGQAGTSGQAGATGQAGSTGQAGTTGRAGTGGTRPDGGASGSGGGQDAGATDGGAVVTFTELYTNFFNNPNYTSNCTGGACHNPGKQKGLDFSSKATGYTTIKQHLTVGNPAGSQIMQQLSSGKMPETRPKMPAADQAKVSAWIQAGAPNN